MPPAGSQVPIVADALAGLERKDLSPRVCWGVGQGAGIAADAGVQLSAVNGEAGHPSPPDALQRRSFADLRTRKPAQPRPALLTLEPKHLRTGDSARIQLTVVDNERIALGAVPEPAAVYPLTVVVGPYLAGRPRRGVEFPAIDHQGMDLVLALGCPDRASQARPRRAVKGVYLGLPENAAYVATEGAHMQPPVMHEHRMSQAGKRTAGTPRLSPLPDVALVVISEDIQLAIIGGQPEQPAASARRTAVLPFLSAPVAVDMADIQR